MGRHLRLSAPPIPKAAPSEVVPFCIMLRSRSGKSKKSAEHEPRGAMVGCVCKISLFDLKLEKKKKKVLSALVLLFSLLHSHAPTRFLPHGCPSLPKQKRILKRRSGEQRLLALVALPLPLFFSLQGACKLDPLFDRALQLAGQLPQPLLLRGRQRAQGQVLLDALRAQHHGPGEERRA